MAKHCFFGVGSINIREQYFIIYIVPVILLFEQRRSLIHISDKVREAGKVGKIKKFLKYNAWLIVLDIVAFNAAYYLALCIRFYVHSQFSSGIGVYLDYYYKFTLYYTVIGLIVFALFRLYDGIWNYAGLNDMNRIIAANAVTALLQILGTRLFIGRMPTSYYLIGAFLQLFITGLTRFSRRFIYMEK